MNINWHDIRSLGGSQFSGFEELCAQLARYKCPVNAKYVRTGAPDAGVECYAVFEDGSEWAWQAKYFTSSLDDSQWGQLDKSVKKALEKHPNLCRYYICLPIDFPDGRIPGRLSAREKWNNRVETWTGLAQEKGMEVEFINWGSSELIDILSEQENAGKVTFWFDNTVAFGNSWFKSKLDESISQAGPRYTPEIHVDLPIAEEFDTFCREPIFIDRVKAHFRPIKKKLRDFEHKVDDIVATKSDTISTESKIIENTRQILVDLCAINVHPIDIISFSEISSNVDLTLDLASVSSESLLALSEMYDEISDSDDIKSSMYNYSYTPWEVRSSLLSLTDQLERLGSSLKECDDLANSNVLILSGDAGTGKTHLLCDVATKRINNGSPTIVLLGQRFLSLEDPWTQVRNQLDLSNISADELVGALEASAQVVGRRAIIFIDALNEGMGRNIWPDNLAAFLEKIKRSPWIGVVLSVRSCYRELVIPENIIESSVSRTHYGFDDYEYDALQIFFSYYGLETPSTPLLAPEFSNPLFLKILCKGLYDNEDHRLSRGFHGVTSIFELFLDATNKKLAKELGFNVNREYVHKAFKSLIEALIEKEERWLPLDVAEDMVNSFYQGADFEHSLYRGLVSEGVLIESAELQGDSGKIDVVYVAYERFADYFIAKYLLDKHLDSDSPEKSFESDAPLGLLCDKKSLSMGLMEALFLLIPERTGKELIELAPSMKDPFFTGWAFRQSLLWRNKDSFFSSTLDILNELNNMWDDRDKTVDIFLTLSTIPGHPWNAYYLHKWLWDLSMPVRDSSWSINLYKLSGYQSSVDRLIDWASDVQPDFIIEDEVVDLCSTSLAWMLSTSDRYLRDNATKAIVNLLTGRLQAVSRLVERFADVDDFYVAERIYAVAYGVALRSNDSDAVGKLASCVYKHVFANENPPAHILLRDYARGVIERALYLEAKIDIQEALIRPPYNSPWPVIPDDDEIRFLFENGSCASYDGGSPAWSKCRIQHSVMDDDFARYVIGTNHNSTHFLSVRLDEPSWQPPEGRLDELVSEFSKQAKAAWKLFDDVNTKLKNEIASSIPKLIRKALGKDSDDELYDDSTCNVLNEERKRSLANLEVLLEPDQISRLHELLVQIEKRSSTPPLFDLSIVQRYVLQRVFDLGWTVDLFGDFDRFSAGSHGRERSRCERIGKKYQWIAYHEIMAFIADNYQYYNRYDAANGINYYAGPWQIGLRDIDPSLLLRTSRLDSVRNKDIDSWWCPAEYNNWCPSQDKFEWLSEHEDLPPIKDLLCVICPDDSSKWVTLGGNYFWKQPSSTGCDESDLDKRNLFYFVTSCLVREEDVEAFMDWAKDVRLSGRWFPEPPRISSVFYGEHVWSPASLYSQQEHFIEGEWIEPGNDCPVRVQATAFEYSTELNGFDSSIELPFSLELLSPFLLNGLELQWDVNNSGFVDEASQVIAFTPLGTDENNSMLLVRQDKLASFLSKEKLALCWVVIGEKRESDIRSTSAVQLISGAYTLTFSGPDGFTKHVLEEWDKEANGPIFTPLD